MSKTIEVSQLNSGELDRLRQGFEHLHSITQSQFAEKGLQVQSASGAIYNFKYNKKFTKVIGKMKNLLTTDGLDYGHAFVHWTKVNSQRANDSKYIMREFRKENTVYKMNGYPFLKENITILEGSLLDKTNLQYFIFKYTDLLQKHAEVETDSGTKVWLAPENGLSSVEQEMLRETEIKKQKGNKMTNKLSTIATTTMDVNKEAIKLAAKLEVGKVATAQLKKVVKPKLPMMVRGYADSPLFDIVLANAVGIALREYAPGNEKAQIVSEAMIQSAAVELMTSFNINDMVNDMLENIDVSKLTDTITKEA